MSRAALVWASLCAAAVLAEPLSSSSASSEGGRELMGMLLAGAVAIDHLVSPSPPPGRIIPPPAPAPRDPNAPMATDANTQAIAAALLFGVPHPKATAQSILALNGDAHDAAGRYFLLLATLLGP